MKLEIELVPKDLFFRSLRSLVTKQSWDVIRREAYKKAGYRCEICGGKGDRWPVECHEIWEHDDERHIQYLKGTIALCPNCHMIKHTGFSMFTENGRKKI